MMKNVFLNGKFELVHDGHIYFFREAKKYGNVLYVGVVADSVVEKNHGRRPFYSQDERIEFVEYVRKEIGLVDHIIKLPSDEEDEISTIVQIRPHIVCFGAGQWPEHHSWNRFLMKRLRELLSYETVEFRKIKPYKRDELSATIIREQHRKNSQLIY
jgi:FAD synthetase